MKLQQHIQQAITNILSAKLRSFLAILGILVGTGSVVALVSGGQLATKKALDQIKSLGSDLMSVSVYNQSASNKGQGEESLDLNHIYQMLEYNDNLTMVAPYTNAYAPILFDDKRLGSSVVGATEELQYTIKISMNKGRFISFMDNYEYYCVIGHNIYQKIKNSTKENVIGSQIKLGNFYFTIVGVADYWVENSFFHSDINNSVLIPIQASSIVSKFATIRDIVLKLKEKSDIDVVQADIDSYISNISPNYKTNFKSARQIIQSMESQSKIFSLMLGMIGGISLLVGGIGIMNVMLVSVVERKREIGIRMAVGAKRKDIRTLFLIESVTLTVFGGIVGIILGIFASYIIAYVSGWGFALFLTPPILGFVVSCITGVFFGYYPAYSASKLDPIQTLRHE